MFCSKFVHFLSPVQHNLNTVEVDPHSDLLHVCITSETQELESVLYTPC
jgi:hypothetical protein